MIDERYPIGTYTPPERLTPELRENWTNEIAALPVSFRAALDGLNDDQLDTPYREGGWTLRQVAHHVPDSHMNAFVRFKWTLTEDLPTIKAYDETLWAKLGDVEDTPIETSLQLLECLHQRWVVLLNSLSDEDLKRGYLHPEFLAHADSVLSNDEVREILKSGDFNGIPDYVMPLGRVMGLYAWHGKHHVAHITTLRDRLGW